MWPDWGDVAMFIGRVAQNLHEGYENLKATTRQAPGQTANSISNGLSNGNIKKGLVNAFVHNTIKATTGTNSDKRDVAAIVTGEIIQLGAGDIAKVGDLAKMGEAAKVGEVAKIADEATVVRGGIATPEQIAGGIGQHPEGPFGFSVECGNCSIGELGNGVRNKQIGVTWIKRTKMTPIGLSKKVPFAS